MSQSVPPDAAESTAAPDTGSLWRDGNFLRFWSGQALSQFGAEITGLAIPVLAVIALGADEWEVGVLNAAQLAAFLLIGLPAGAWIDRMRKRRVMIAADGVRALALATIPVLWMLGALEMWHLIAVAFVVGIAMVFFDVSYQSVVPALVPSRQIAEANGKLESTQQIAGLSGPAIGGVIVGALTAPVAVLVTVGTYVASLIALLATRDHEQPRAADDRAPLRTEIAEGLRWVFGHALLRRIVATTGLSNLFSTVSMTMLPLFLLRELGFTPEAMGLILSLSAVGGLLGAIATPRLAARLGEARLIPVSAIAFSIVALILPIAAVLPAVAFPLLVAQGFVLSAAILVYNITQVTFRQRITPSRLLGRMNASIRFCVWGVMPLAALSAGLLGETVGVVGTMWIGALGCLLSALPVVIGPFWRMRTLPQPD